MNKDTETSKVTLDDVSDFSNVCRTCATITDFVIPIFIGEGAQNKLAEKIRKHLPIQLSEQDVLPHVLCYQCASTLLAWHELVKCCVQADAALNQRLAVLGLSSDTKTNEDQSQGTDNINQNKSMSKNTPETDVQSMDTSEKPNATPIKMCSYCEVKQSMKSYKNHLISIHTRRSSLCEECHNYIDRKEFGIHTSHRDVANSEISEKEVGKVNKNRTKKGKDTRRKQYSGPRSAKRKRNLTSGTRRVENRKRNISLTDALEDEFSDSDYFDQLPLSVFQAIEDSHNDQTVHNSNVGMEDSCVAHSQGVEDTSANTLPVDTGQGELQAFGVGPSLVPSNILETSGVESQKAIPDTLDSNAAIIIENQPNCMETSSDIRMEHQSNTFDSRSTVLLGHQSHTFDGNATVFMREQPQAFDTRTAVYMRPQAQTLDARSAVIMGPQPHTFDTSSGFIMRPSLNNLETSNAVIMIHQPHPFDTSGAVIMRPHLNTLDASNAVIMIHQPQTFDTGSTLIMRHPPHTLNTNNALITIHQPHAMDTNNAVIAIHQPHVLGSSEAVTVRPDNQPWYRKEAATDTQVPNNLESNQVDTAVQPVTKILREAATQVQPHSAGDSSDATEFQKLLTSYSSADNAPVTKKKERTCPVCLKVFLASSSYFYHIKHSHNRRKDYECEICKVKFIAKQSLREHSTIHTGAFPFQCEECWKKFRSRASLYIHRQIHIGKKGYACSLCDKSFRWRTQLRRHVKRHEAEKVHVCATCGRGFAIHADLLRHARTHDARSFACDICDNKFAQKRYLKEHINRKHSANKKKDK